MAVLIVLTPLGLLARGTAWGEWSSEELFRIIGFVPEGLARLKNLWKGVFSGYFPPGWSGAWASAGYFLSALLGVVVIVGVTFFLGRWLAKDDERREG